MGKQHLSRDDRIFMDGKRRGTQECMDMVAMALIDKCGWHVQEETPDSRDTHSIAYLYECLERSHRRSTRAASSGSTSRTC